MTTIGKRLRYARKNQHLTLTDLHIQTGLSPGNLSELENDKFMPSAHALISLHKALNISIDWILTGQGDNHNEEQTLDNVETLSLDEKELIHKFRNTTPEIRKGILCFLNVVTES